MISAPTDLPTSPQAPDWMAEIWCRRSTCAISWARTPASSDSLARRFTRPCETITVPPGIAKALIVSVSITPKVQGRSGFSVCEASQRPHAIHVALQALVRVELRRAEEARCDPFAERDLLVDGIFLRRFLDLLADLDGLLAEFQDIADVAQLGVRRQCGGRRGQERQRECAFHQDPFA